MSTTLVSAASRFPPLSPRFCFSSVMFANQAFRKSDLVRDQRRDRNAKLAVASPLDERRFQDRANDILAQLVQLVVYPFA